MKLLKGIATLKQLKAEYKKLAMMYHPDNANTGNIEKMQVLNNEYEILFPRLKMNDSADSNETVNTFRSEFYTQNGWKGSNYASSMSTKEITAKIRAYVKEEFNHCRFSVTFSSYAGGSSISVTLTEAPESPYRDERECDGASVNHHYISTNESLKAEYKVMFELIVNFINSYRYDDSDSMIDYFSTNFYYSLNIGKYSKPFSIVHRVKKVEKVSTVVEAPETTPAAEEVQQVVEVQEVAQQPVEAKKNVSVEVNYNQEKNGIELKFTDKPSDEVRANLKSNGFRWSKFNSVWYAKDTQDTRDFVNSYFNTDNQNETPEEPQTAVYPEIEVNDIETYTVSQELSDRENAGHWVFRSDKRDHQTEIQNTLQGMNNDVLGLLEGVTDAKTIYNAKRWLQSYKKRYYEWYMKKLRQDANNPSWVVTGRDGRNRGKDAKYQSAYDKLMKHYIDELKPEYESKLWSIKKQVKKIKQQSEEVELQKAIEEAQPIELTRTKGLVNYHARANESVFVGGTVEVTIYKYNDYAIVKTWGSWRIYKNGIELSGDRYATLDTAKQVLSVEVAKAA